MNSIGVTQPEEVSEEHIVAYIIHKKETCNGTSVNTYFRFVRAWFNWMVGRGIINKSPLASLKPPTIPKTVIKPLDYEQIQRMLACCSKYFSGRRDRTIVALIFDSGLRRSEISNIKLADIDLKRGAIRVMGKGAKERYVAIGEVAKKITYTKEQLIAWMKIFCKGELLDEDYQHQIIDVFVNSVYLYDDRMVIYYNIKDGKQISYIDMIKSTEEPPFGGDPELCNGVRILEGLVAGVGFEPTAFGL